jgi:hypothetical protein
MVISNSITSLKIRLKPNFSPPLVVKQPQVMSSPRTNPAIIAIINIVKSPDMTSALAPDHTPEISNSPETNSTHGRMIAKMLTRKCGRIL